MAYKYLYVALIAFLSCFTPTMSFAATQPDWRIVWRNKAKYTEDEFINIKSIKQIKPGIFSFSTYKKAVYVKSEIDFRKITVNCNNDTITYNQSITLYLDGTRRDNTDIVKLFNGQGDYKTKPYCEALKGGAYTRLPRTYIQGVTYDSSRGGSSVGTTGNCQYPGQRDSLGRLCGKRSAESRPGGK